MFPGSMEELRRGGEGTVPIEWDTEWIPQTFPRSWKGVGDPTCFCMSWTHLPLRIYGSCPKATGRRIRGLRIQIRPENKKSKSVPISVRLSFSQDLWVGASPLALGCPNSTRCDTAGGCEAGGRRETADLLIFGLPSFALPSDILSGFS